MKSSFSKKIALVLIMVMVGTWSVSAAEQEEESPEGTVIAVVAVIGALGLIAWLFVAAFGDDNYAQVSVDGIVPTSTEINPLETLQAKSQPEDKSTIFEHLMLGTDGETVYTGLRFQF